MPRLNMVKPENATGKAKELFEGPLKQKQLNIFQSMANNPKVLEAFLNFSNAVKSAGSLRSRDHELIALACGSVNGCDYCKAVHSKIAHDLGLSEEAIDKAMSFQADDEKHQAILTFARGIVEKKGFVTDEEINEFKAAGFDDAAIVEVIGALTVNTFTNYFNHVNETEIDPVFQTAGASS